MSFMGQCSVTLTVLPTSQQSQDLRSVYTWSSPECNFLMHTIIMILLRTIYFFDETMFCDIYLGLNLHCQGYMKR